jgi:hypothetical protein
MLSEAEIERYSRQIILPEVGGRGQVRWLAARATVGGAGDAARVAATLLERAGVGRVERVAGDTSEVTIDFGPGAVLGVRSGDEVRVATVVGRPCAACVGLEGSPAPASVPTAADLALGALAASEALLALLATPPAGRLQRLDLGAGTASSAPLASAGCARCRS